MYSFPKLGETMETISRKQAQSKQLGTYFTGRACKNGHIAERYTRDCTCVECKKERTSAYTRSGYFKQDYHKNKERRLAKGKEYAKHNPEKISTASNAWNKRNKKRMDEYRTEYYSNPDNKRRHLNGSKEYRNKHRAKYAAHCRTRQARKLQATPKWLTPNDFDEIEQIYQRSVNTTEQTGIKHVVDHYYPLQGETVSGLHCPSNLRILTEVENATKGNKHPEEVK